MAEDIKQQGDYYYDLTPEAEDIDNVLIDLTKILKSDPLNNKISVNISTEKEQREGDAEPRYHFQLGDGGADVPEDLDRILSSDGAGGLKLNEGKFYSKNNNGAAILQTPSKIIEIKSTQNSTEQYYGWDHGLKFHMDGESLLQMIYNNGSPVFSMRGTSIIDIDSVYYHNSGPDTSKRTDSANWLSLSAGLYYSKVDSALISEKKLYNDNMIYPLVQIKESSTVFMEGSPLVHICGGASLLMDGNADVRFRGSGYNRGHKQIDKGRTLFIVDPGSTFIMEADGSEHNPAFFMNSKGEGQIILTNEGRPISSTSDSNNYYWNLQGVWDKVYWGGPFAGVLSFIGGYSAMQGTSPTFVREKLCINSPDHSPILNAISAIHQPTFGLQGRTNIILGDQGSLAMRIATTGAIVMDWTSWGNTAIKMGNGTGATSVYEIVPANNSNTHFKFSPDEGAATAIAIEPHGSFSFKVSPEVSCGISFTPKNTDIVCQWDSFEGIFEGDDVFAQIEGNSHFEFLDDSTVIMRGPGAYGRDTETLQNTSIDTAIKIVTSTNCDGFTYEDFWNTLSNSEKEKVNDFLCPNSSSHGRQIIDGTVTATEFYPDRYNIVLGGIIVNKALGSSKNFYFYASTRNYNVDVIVNWNEFKNAVKNYYGKNAVATEVSIKGIVWSYTAGAYNYDIQAKIENASLSYNSVTQYEIGTSFNDLTETDKKKDEFKYKDLWDFSAATVISNDVRSDMKYTNVCQDYTYKTGTHLVRDWEKPVSTQTGPISQMYGLSNFCMRGVSEGRFSKIETFVISPTKTYDFTRTLPELITDFINGADYASFVASYEEYLTDIENTGFHFDHIISINQSEQDLSITAIFEYELVEHQRSFSPLIEMIGESEVRIANGISIKTDNIDGKSVIKFEAPEKHISFTMDELQKLKDLISST